MDVRRIIDRCQVIITFFEEWFEKLNERFSSNMDFHDLQMEFNNLTTNFHELHNYDLERMSDDEIQSVIGFIYRLTLALKININDRLKPFVRVYETLNGE